MTNTTLTADTITDNNLREAIAELDTDLCSLHAALKVKSGPLVHQLRERAAEILNARAKESR